MTPTSEFDYRKYLRLVWNKRYLFVVIALALMTAVVVTCYMLPDRYEAKCTVFIEKSVISDLVKGIAVTPSMDDKIRVLTYAMKSRSLLLKVLNDLDLNVGNVNEAQQERMVKAFQGGTDIKLKDKEGLFIISFNHENPRLARDYVNTLVRRYIEENVSSKREDSYDATRFLTEQIAPVKEKFEKAEERVNAFVRDNGSILAQGQGQIQSEIAEAQRSIDEIAIKRNQLESLRKQVIKNDPLQAKLSGLHKRLNELNLVYTDSYPEVIEVKTLIESVKEQMKAGSARVDVPEQSQYELDKLAMEMRTLQDAERNQRRLIASKRELMRKIPEARTTLEELEREKIAQKNLYEQLMVRQGQSEVSKQMEVQDKTATFRIVDPAVLPIKPVSPNRMRIILFGIFGALAASFGILVLLDNMDKSVRSLEELKSLGIPVLAVVPRITNIAQTQVARRRDIWFFTASAVYFSLILATLSLEYARNYSLSFLRPAQIVQNITELKNTLLK